MLVSRNRSARARMPWAAARRMISLSATRPKESKMTNYDVERYVTEELHWDPKIDDRSIAVSADDGVVTLRGTVGSLREKLDAKKDAERVYGVIRVDNKLEVRILNKDRRADADLRGDVLKALMLNTLVPPSIDVKVDDGVVRLTGEANWQYQRDEAESVATRVQGVVGVVDEVQLVAPGPSVDDVKHAIKKAMERNAKIDAESVEIESSNGTVTLHGLVSSWADHDEAVSAAWAAPGVTEVKDHILVAY
jgi:osmotically-inducible protein OsmY